MSNIINLSGTPSVDDAAHALREAVWSSENGGTNGTPAKVREAARTLLDALEAFGVTL